MFRGIRSTAAAAVVVAALSGCSLLSPVRDAPPTTEPAPTTSAESAQTAKEACELLRPVLVDMSTRMTEAYGVLQQGGPKAASPMLHDISDNLHAALDEITNTEVHDVTSTAIDSLDAMTAEIDAIIAGNGDPDALLEASGAVNRDFSAIDPVCEAAY